MERPPITRTPGARVALRVLLALGLLLALFLPSGPVRADGGTLRLADLTMGAYRVSVFTAPSPITPDSLDVSLLITDPDGLTVARGVEVWVEVTPLDHPGTRARHRATREQADEPRFYAAKFALGTPGRWQVKLDLQGPRGSGTASFEITAREPNLLERPLVLVLAALAPLLLAFLWLRGGSLPDPDSGP